MMESSDKKIENSGNDENTNESTLTSQKSHSYLMHTMKPPQYDKIYGSDYQFSLVMTQMSARKGIKQFGKKAIEALATEWKQLDDLSIFKGRTFESLMAQERKQALRTVQLIKQKKDGKIKGCTCVNGSRQRYYTAEEEATSPTVSTEALLLTAAIDASEGQSVTTCDITGAFLKAGMDEFVLISLH